jgi:hypothetical protein
VIRCASILWRLALTALLGIMAYFAFQFGQHAASWTERVIDRQADKTRAELSKSVTDSRKDILREVAALRKDTMRQMDDLRTTADARIAAIAASADAQLARTNDTVAALRSDLRPTLAHMEAITAHADEASGILLARNALPAQLLGVTAAAKVTLGETAQTMRTVRDVAATEGPATAKAVRIAAEQAGGIATDVHTFTTEATRPVPWYRKVGSILYSGARLGTALF